MSEEDPLITPEEFEELTKNLDMLVAIVAGYHNKLMEAGFQEHAATHMTLEFHWVLMRKQLMGGFDD